MTVYWFNFPSEWGFPVKLAVPVGIAAGPPSGPLNGAPGITTHTYLKGEPAPPTLPTPPHDVDAELERIAHSLLRWGGKYDALDMGTVLNP